MPSRTPAACAAGEEIADARPRRRPARAERMRSRQLRRGGHDNHLAGARSLDLLEHASQRTRPIAQPVRLAAPVALGRKQHQRGLREPRELPTRRPAPAGSGRGPRRPDRTPRPTGARRRGPACAERMDRRSSGAEQREHEVAPRIEVVHDDEQLAEAGLSEVVGEQLGVAAGEVLRVRLSDLRAAANRAPTAPRGSRRRPPPSPIGAASAAHQNPPRCRRRAGSSRVLNERCDRDRRGEHQHHRAAPAAAATWEARWGRTRRRRARCSRRRRRRPSPIPRFRAAERRRTR